ncbi:hypothetical protein T02_11359 [Trichinella nativa]|uniref:Uncharacterized protein n=1 Tax=Trichinella nativa TaxID=6335 RepID=A0A0V1L8G6_9BILA|nr:hypothetical protein T02_11359 [Trichinella nativa]
MARVRCTRVISALFCRNPVWSFNIIIVVYVDLMRLHGYKQKNVLHWLVEQIQDRFLLAKCGLDLD